MFNKHQVFSVVDVPSCVQLLSNAVYEEEDCERAQAACDRVEEFLRNAKAELRDMVAIEMFESIQDSGCLADRDSLARFFGPETRRIWDELPAIWKMSLKLDLQDRAVLEGEVLLSRICADLRSRHS